MRVAVFLLLISLSVTSMAHIGRNKIFHRWPHMLSLTIEYNNTQDIYVKAD